MKKKRKTIYLKRGQGYNAYVTSEGKSGQGSRPRRVATIDVPERVSLPVSVRRMEKRR